MANATEEQQFKYFENRVYDIKRRKLDQRYELIPSLTVCITKGDLLTALITGAATLKKENYGSIGAPFSISENDVDWPEFTQRVELAYDEHQKAKEAFDNYRIGLIASVDKIVDQVVLGKLKPLDAIAQIEKLD